jgi:hypothetical protein
VGALNAGRVRVDCLRTNLVQLLSAQRYDFVFAHKNSKKKAGQFTPRLIVVSSPFASLVNLDDCPTEDACGCVYLRLIAHALAKEGNAYG